MTRAESNTALAEPAGYSPPLTITLDMGGQTFNVAATAPEYVILRDAADVPPGEAVLHVDIDGDVRSETLHFRKGLRADERRQPHDRRPPVRGA